MFNEKIKKDFPILERRFPNGKQLTYLDSAATTQKPEGVIDAMDAYYRTSNSNVHRGIHTLAEEATAAYEDARLRIARFVGVTNPKQIIFTRNTTESINLAAMTWGQKYLAEGDLVLTTQMEHHSNIVPWFMLRDQKGINLEFIHITSAGTIDLDHYASLLAREPKLVAFTHISNVLGTINPAKQMIAAAHTAGALVLVDGAQSVPHLPVHIEDLDADFYAFSAHKMCGPTGIGVLYGKSDLLEAMPPFLGGGDMIKKVTFSGFKTNEIPYKFEAGTPSIAEAVGFGAAVDYLAQIGMQEIFDHEQQLAAYGYAALDGVSELRLLGPSADNRSGVLSFTIEGIHPHDIAQILNEEGIAVRAGHHCAMPLHDLLEIPASTRASLYLYNTQEDIDLLVNGLKKVIEVFE